MGLSAGALVEERRRALEAGMDAFLTKPIEPAELLRVVRAAIESRTGRPVEVRAAPAASTDTASAWPVIDGINPQQAAQRCGDDAALYLRLLRHMLGEFADLSVALPGDEDPEGLERTALRRRAHKLAGSAAQLGAEGLSRAARDLERCLSDATSPASRVHGQRQRLADALSALGRASAPALREAQAQLDSARAQGTAAAPTALELAWLRRRLQAQEIDALDWIEQHMPLLLAFMPPEAGPTLAQAVLRLDFEAALRCLEAGEALEPAGA